MAPVAPRSGDAIFANVERVNAELFTLTYGAIVRQLLTDLEEVEEVNKQLDQMGYNIGIRLIDEFLAKSNVSRCIDFKETAEVIAKSDLRSTIYPEPVDHFNQQPYPVLLLIFNKIDGVKTLGRCCGVCTRRCTASSSLVDDDFEQNFVTHHSPTQLLKNFDEIKLLRIELPSGELGIDEGALLKWRADFGSTLDNCVILGEYNFGFLLGNPEGIWS
ncbi:hypothetical protein MTR67_042181 [Solanum verrucosum]|uniref:Trafficking protein particle complex subunit n=1 Tax=Solanum verrucosum TaxID=315347 RepID=A0AAF0ZRG4_SOLVR|nr:hypothetical protein MTR67_042181 [Solanum verrucosum]